MKNRTPLIVLHVIVGLGDGGAEVVLYRLLTSRKATARAVVVSLTDRGVYGEALERAGIQVHSLGMSRGRLTLSGFLSLCRLIRRISPDVVQTWMYHSDLVGGIAAWMAGCRRVVWGLHNSTLDPFGSSLSARLARRMCAWLSGLIPRRIISCSERGVSGHRALGYADKFTVVRYGYDAALFAPDKAARDQTRTEWGVPPAATLVGVVGRWAAQKDHPAFLRAAAVIRLRRPDVRWVLVGRGCDRNNADLQALIVQLGLSDAVLTVGSRRDIPAVMNALDIHVLASSFGEAFPNVVAEAMACGTPCVVTDVGDASSMLGGSGWVAPPADLHALVAAIDAALTAIGDGAAWAERQQTCRRQVVEHLSLDAMVDAYEGLWREVAAP